MKQPEIINLPKIGDKRGNLSLVEEFKQIPFKIERTYWIYDVPGGESRGGHAYKMTHEFIVAISGGFDVTVDDGKEKKSFTLNRSYYGLFVPKGLWRTMENFSTNSLALEFANTVYDRSDYIDYYEDFQKLRNDGEI